MCPGRAATTRAKSACSPRTAGSSPCAAPLPRSAGRLVRPIFVADRAFTEPRKARVAGLSLTVASGRITSATGSVGAEDGTGEERASLPSAWPSRCASARDDHLEGLRLRCAAEGVIGIDDGVEREPVAHELLWRESSLRDEPEQHLRRGGAHQAGGDRDVLDLSLIHISEPTR